MQSETSGIKVNRTVPPSITKPRTTKEKLSLGLALFVLGAILVFGGSQNSNFENYTFANEPVEVRGFSPSDIDESNLPNKILIPDLSIELDIKRAEIINGYWEVHEDLAAWGEGSGLPGEAGNQVIFAHSRVGLFLPLKDVQEGMKVYILTQNDWYQYKVEEIKEVFPNETQVIAPTDDETLTLYTCSGFGDSRRLIVIAKRII